MSSAPHPHATELELVPWSSEIEPAPGELRLLQAFVNTVGFGQSTEELRDTAALGKWLTHWGFAAPDPGRAKEDLRRAHQMRHALRALVLASHGTPIEGAVISRLQQAASSAPLTVSFAPDGGSSFVPQLDGLDGALARIFIIVTVMRPDPRWSRLRACANEACRQVFYDASPNRSGRWCTARCGYRIRTRDARRRSKAWRSRRRSWR